MKILRRTFRHPDGTVRAVHEIAPPSISVPSVSSVVQTPGSVGLGDLVEKLAKPIARASDKLFGTHLAGCSACSHRRAVLNKWIPDLRKAIGKKAEGGKR